MRRGTLGGSVTSKRWPNGVRAGRSIGPRELEGVSPL